MTTRSDNITPRRIACLLLACLVLHALPAFATHAPSASAPGLGKVAPVALRGTEAAGPVRTEAGAQLQFGQESGLLRHYYLRTPGTQMNKAAAPEVTATRFLVENAAALGLDPARIDSELQLASQKESPSGMHYTWKQVVDGVPVFRSEIVVKVSNLGEVSSMHSSLQPDIHLSTVAAFDASRAVQIGIEAVQPTGKPLGDYKAELAIVAYDGGPQLTYLVSIPVESPLGDWRVYVDAKTGAVRGIEDRMVNYVDGTGRVFAPDPKTKMNNTTYVDASDADSAVPFPDSYDTVTLKDITNTAGTYSLYGPYVHIMEIESPVIAPVTTTDPNAFLFQRNADAFEDVNVYYHLDNTQRWVQSLGFTNANNRSQPADSHGVNGDDNSHYVPSTGILAFGDGGVDDGEDADVVIHEYGHAMQDNIVPGWGGGQEGAMGEGFGDYLAGSYSYAVNPTFEPSWVYNWDGHNSFWAGRVLVDSTMHYPEDCCGEVHDSGTLWCSGLFDAMRRVGRTPMDKIVIDHHFALGTSATMADAAQQIIQSDIDLYGGAHIQALVAVFDFYGFVNAEDFVPSIAHTPLVDTEDTTGPYPVTAVITSVQPLDASSLYVHWGVGALTDSLLMAPTANPNEYSASIPGPLSNVDVRYYIIAKDTNGGVATHPAGAPASYHQFHIGADTTPPVITHTPIADWPLVSWPAAVNATVTDNLGVNTSSVSVAWTLNTVAQTPFSLARVGVTNNYTGSFPGGGVAIGDVITYDITASDIATVPNTTRHPAVGEHSFTIIDILGRILVVDDDDVAKAADMKLVEGSKDQFRSEVPNAQPVPPGTILSANAMAQVLNDAGYLATVEPIGTTNPATWSSYDLIVSSSGANTGPVASATYRSAVEAWVAAGHKLLVEGGEVVYDAASYPGYPTFAANVLHTTDWDADNSGALTLISAQALHPIVTTPYALPSTMSVAYASYGSQDAYKPNAPAYIVYGTASYPAEGGLLVYDNTPAPQSAQIVVFGFDYKVVGDATTRAHLLLNTVAYLLANEPAPTGGVSGVAKLANQLDHSGITITLNPGGRTTTTDTNGNYSFSTVYPGTYTLTAAKTNYFTETRTSVLVADNTITSGQDFKLYPQAEVSYCLTPNLTIPDNNATGVMSIINVGELWAVQGVEVQVNITHTWIGDLIVELRHGAHIVRLHNKTGSSADNIIGTYPTTLAVDGPGALTDFVGDAANGTWTLFLSDTASGDTGKLVSWCLKLKGPKDTTVGVDPVDRMPQVESLSAGTNPMRGAGTTVRFALTQDKHASLVVYNVAGQKVRTLVDAVTPAGYHDVHWDGRDAAGTRVAAGVYFYQLLAGETTLTRKLVVIR